MNKIYLMTFLLFFLSNSFACLNELNKCDWKKHTWYTSATDSYESRDNDSECLEPFNFPLDVHKINDSDQGWRFTSQAEDDF